jgi:hypothetical protein
LVFTILLFILTILLFILLVILLLYRSQGSSGYFHEYISALPGFADKDASETVLNTPLYWDDESLSYARDNLPQQQTVKVSNSIRASLILFIRLFNELAVLVKDGRDKKGKSKKGWVLDVNDYSWQRFKWAISVVMSRQNVVPVASTGATELALIPVWDLMNHSLQAATSLSTPNPNVVASAHASHIPDSQTFFNPDTASIDFKTPIDVHSGAEISMFYGARSNLDLLIYSGFTLSENPFDTVYVSLPTLLFLNEQLPAEDKFSFVETAPDSRFDKIKTLLFKAYVESDVAGGGAAASGASTKNGSMSLHYPSVWRRLTSVALGFTVSIPAPPAGEQLVLVSAAPGNVALLEEVPFGFIYSCFLHVCSQKDELSQLLRATPTSADVLFQYTTTASIKACIDCALAALAVLLKVEYKYYDHVTDVGGATGPAQMRTTIDEENWCYVDSESTTAKSIPNSPARPQQNESSRASSTGAGTGCGSSSLVVRMIETLRSGQVKIIRYYQDQLTQYKESI